MLDPSASRAEVENEKKKIGVLVKICRKQHFGRPFTDM